MGEKKSRIFYERIAKVLLKHHKEGSPLGVSDMENLLGAGASIISLNEPIPNDEGEGYITIVRYEGEQFIAMYKKPYSYQVDHLRHSRR